MRKRNSLALQLVCAALITALAGGVAWAKPAKTPKKGSILGQVTDPAGLPVEGALVSSGDSSATTDPGGLYRLDDISFKQRVSVTFEAAGFATTFGVIDLFDRGLADDDSDSDSDSDSGDSDSADSDSGDSDSSKGRKRGRRGRKPKKVKTIDVTLNKALVPAGAIQTVNASAGGSASEAGFVATFPGGALDAPGDVEVVITPIDVSTSEIDAFPGDFVGIQITGESTLLETFSLMNVDLVDAATGEPVSLAPGAIASLEFLLPTSTSLAVGDTVGLWFYDEADGLWVEEEVGVVGDSSQVVGRLAVFADVSHFSWWNCDRGIDTFNCYTGQVVDSTGAPVAGASVFGKGVDYSGTSHDQTDAAGSYCVNVRRNSLVDIQAVVNFGNTTIESQIIQVDTSLPDGATVSCATGGCTTVADLALEGLTCISGDVRDELDDPVEGLIVVSNAGPSAVTDAAGAFCIAAPSNSDVSVVASGFPSVEVTTGPTGPNCDDPAGCTIAEIRPDVTGTAACLKGRVIFEGFPTLDPGDPIPGADVIVSRDEPPFEQLGQGITDANGEFCITSLPANTPVNVVIESIVNECDGGDDNFNTGPAGTTCAVGDCADVGDLPCGFGGD